MKSSLSYAGYSLVFDGVHERKKPYECGLCQSRYFAKSALKRHTESVHGDKTYECDICSKTFSVKSNLDRHVKLIHNKEKRLFESAE